MDHLGRPPKKVEEIPEDLRCKRSDGKQWRCSALSMPDKTVCEKHYIQAKKRAANSALRASLKKGKRSLMVYDDINTNMPRSMSSMNADVKGNNGRSQVLLSSDARQLNDPVILDGQVRLNEEDRIGLAYNMSYLSKDVNLPSADCHVKNNGKKPEFTNRDGITCHQCGANEGVNVVWCINCDQNGYCASCILQWYADIHVDEFRKRCPACQNICSCKTCLSGDNLIKNKVQEISGIDKLWYLHSLLSYVLPFLKQIYSGQCFEIAVETKIHGVKTDIPRANINADEQMCCNLCKIPILDFHRHCPECFFDLCLTCCRDIRRVSSVIMNGDSSAEADKHMKNSKDEIFSDFSHLYPKWKASSDGSISCPPKEAGGCGSSKLALRRILKINWVAKLVKNAEEIVTGCKVTNIDDADKCNSEKIGLHHHHCYHRNDNIDNLVYCPTSENLKKEGINHFRKHWLKGQPIMIRNVFDHSLASSWDPMSIWRGIHETNEGMPDDNTLVKVTDCMNKSEIDIDFTQFIKGYSEGLINKDGSRKMLMLKDWPHPSAWEEFIFCQRPEFITNLPLVEFIHSKWGLLNLAAKIPHDIMQIDVEPKIFISYGAHNEIHSDVPATNLRINMGDMVYLLMHSTYPKIHDNSGPNDKEEIFIKSSEEKPQSDECLSNSNFDMEECNGNGGQPKIAAGALWDIFRRQDVPKLNDFFRLHWEELTTNSCQPVTYPVYEQTWYVNEHHKQKLKVEYGIEPWTLEQRVGEAIFVPAGCPFQVRNLQSTVQLGLDFLFPESLSEATKLTEEIRLLPNDHNVKLTMWEIGKMTLYAASSAIREIHKIVLDPNSNLETKFEDKKLTAMVVENLEKLTKRKQIACT